MYPATYLPRLISKRLRERDPVAAMARLFVIAFTGVRGAVSLAAALALPFALPGGEAFPYRDLILFVAFGVIFMTLVGHGLGLAAGGALARRRPGRPQRASSPSMKPRSRHGAKRSMRRSSRSTPSPTNANCPTRWSSCCARGTKPASTSCRTSLDPEPSRRLGGRHRADARADRRRAKFIHVLLRDGKITDEIAAPDRARPGPGRGKPGQQGVSGDAVVVFSSLRAKRSNPELLPWKEFWIASLRSQ